MNDIDKDWYTYLTEDFKLDRKSYKTSDRAVVDCPKCGITSTIRINHLKSKIKKLGYFECGPCRKKDGAAKARQSCKEKYNGKNPFELDQVKEKIKKTNLDKYGVECLLKKPEIHQKGVKAAAKLKEQNRQYDADYSKITCK